MKQYMLRIRRCIECPMYPSRATADNRRCRMTSPQRPFLHGPVHFGFPEWCPLPNVPKLKPEITNRRLGPMPAGHPSLCNSCAACQKFFHVGNFTTLITLGPGDFPDEQAKRDAGQPYTAVTVEVHWDCASRDAIDHSEAT